MWGGRFLPGVSKNRIISCNFRSPGPVTAGSGAGGLKEVKTFSERSGANEGAEERSLEVFSAYHVVWG